MFLSPAAGGRHMSRKTVERSSAMTRAVFLTAALAGAGWAPPGAHAAADLARELKEAQAALAAGDYDKAYPQYLHFAEKKNNPLAQFTLGMFHRLGWGRPVDRAAACAWYERAAEGKIPTAAHFLGECFEQGIGRPADPARAAVWYERAAGLGHYMSLCSLAGLYMSGRGVPKDAKKGLALCRQAAERGAVPARVRVGRYLLEGEESIRDPEAAHAWFEAAAATSPEAQYYLGLMHRDGLGHAKAPDEARSWFERAASRGYVPAYFQTARLYLAISPDLKIGRPSEDHLAKAYMWLSATAKRSRNADELKQTGALLDQVLAIMPKTWVPTLDERVAAHLAEHPAAP
jgi:TPR repeat protein